MRVLVACEWSGVVRDAFRARGHDAFSCDLIPCAPASNEAFHLIGDARQVAAGRQWDLLIAFPPCTYLCSSGLHWNGRRPGRAALTEEALEFVRELMAAPVDRIAIENPRGCIGSRIRLADQMIQPYMFGDDASKETHLWLKGLPTLIAPPAERWVAPRLIWDSRRGKTVKRWANQTDSGQNKLAPSEGRAAARGKTYPGIAAAMAEQWGRV